MIQVHSTKEANPTVSAQTAAVLDEAPPRDDEITFPQTIPYRALFGYDSPFDWGTPQRKEPDNIHHIRPPKDDPTIQAFRKGRIIIGLGLAWFILITTALTLDIMEQSTPRWGLDILVPSTAVIVCVILVMTLDGLLNKTSRQG